VCCAAVRGSPDSARDESAILQIWPTVWETKWSEVHASFERQHDSLQKKKPDATQEIEIIRTIPIKIKQLV
jgi:hypothetical protein